jgi:GT2 family glycosyltransferase
LDDDAEFVDPNTVQATLKLFEHPCIGAVAVPFINRSPDGSESRMVPPVPDPSLTWVTNTFIGTAFAVRRDAFLKIGGFQPVLFHWGEESEYSQRLLNAGYFVALGSEGMIHHYPAGAGKYSRKVNRYIYRNGVLTLWFNAPTLLVAPLILARIAASLLGGVRRPKTLLGVLEGLSMALKTICTNWRLRRPISVSRYRLWLRLRRERPVALSKVVSEIETGQKQS